MDDITITMTEDDAHFLFELLSQLHGDLGSDVPMDDEPGPTVRRIMNSLSQEIVG